MTQTGTKFGCSLGAHHSLDYVGMQ